MLTIETVVLVLSLALSALFSGCETGFYLFSRMRLHLGLEEGSGAARRIQALVKRPSLLLTILLIGNNLSLELVTFSSQALFERFSELTPEARATLGALLSTPLVFVLSEAMPKNAFMVRPYERLAWASWPLTLLYRLLWPVGVLLDRVTKGLQRWSRVKEPEQPRREERLHSVLSAGFQEGLLSRTEHLLAANVLRLRDSQARDVAGSPDRMPRLELPASAERWGTALAGSDESRALVHDRDGRIVGLVHAVDLAMAVEQRPEDLESVIRPVPRVSPEMPLGRLLELLARSGVPLAVVEPAPPGRRLVRSRDLVQEILGKNPG